MSIADFRSKVLAGAPLAGTFLKTPAYQLIEVLAQTKLDFVCLDAEHAPFDRAGLDACMAISRALDFPVMVRVGDTSAREILWALDIGAAGIVVPHVDTLEQAQAVAAAARFGPGGRGFAGSTRWAGFATRSMPDVLAQASETVVMAQIESPEAVVASEAIAGVDGIDALFLGPADLSVGYGHASLDNPDLSAAQARVGRAARSQGKAYVTFVADAAQAKALADLGVTVFFIASEYNWLRNAANDQAATVHQLPVQSPSG